MSESNRVQRWRDRMREEGKEPMTLWLDAPVKRRLEELARTQRCAPSDIVHEALAAYPPDPPAETAAVTDTSLLRELIQEELAQRPDHTPVSALVTDMAQLQQLIQAEVTTHQEQLVTMVIDQCLALITPGLPKLMEETVRVMSGQALAGSPPGVHHTAPTLDIPDTVTKTVTAKVTDTVADTNSATDTVTDTYRERAVVTGNDTDTVTDTDNVTETVTERVTDTTAAPRDQPRAYGDVPAGVLATLAHRASATPAELSKALGDDTKAGTKRVWQALQRLCKSGKVVQEGKRYRLPT
jgi:hypothetical protein